MSYQTQTANRTQQALQTYLDALLQDAEAVALAQSISEDEFAAAVAEEQAIDAERRRPVLLRAVSDVPAVAPKVPEAVALAEPPLLDLALHQAQEVVDESVTVESLASTSSPVVAAGGPPAWAQEPFECLLFDVAGLTLAVPLVSLGTIHPLEGQEMTSLFGQAEWFLGLLPGQEGNLKVIDAARWVMPERYRDDFREGLRYVISLQGCDWGLAVHNVSHSIRIDPGEVKWRGHRSQRPWLAGTVIEHMCALLDVELLANLLAAGAKQPRQGNAR